MMEIQKVTMSAAEQERLEDLMARLGSGEVTMSEAMREAAQSGSRFVSQAIAGVVDRYRLSIEDSRALRQARLNHMMVHGADADAVKAIKMSQAEEALHQRRHGGGAIVSSAVIELLASDVRPHAQTPDPEDE